MKLKTLKDMGFINLEQRIKLRLETIKWVKEDYEDWRSPKGLFQSQIIARWMERLNITEEDLKL